MDAGQVRKLVRWSGAAWECDTLRVVVYTVDRKTGRREPIDIQPDWISIASEPDVLQMEAPVPAEDHAWTVPLKVSREDLGPSSIIMGPSRLPQVNGTIGQYVEENLPQETGPTNPLKIKVTVTVNMVPEVATAALSMAGGIPFGILRSATQLLKQEVTYEVEPPPFPWTAQQDQPVRLGPEKQQPAEMKAINLRCAPPKGWLFDVSVRFLIESRCVRLGLQSGGAQLVDSGTEEELAAQIQLAGGQLCLKPAGTVSADGSEGDVPLRFLAITESPYVGRRVSRFEVQAQAQAVAVYLGGRPADNYIDEGYNSAPTAAFEWNDDNRVSVIGERYEGKEIPERCRLQAEVRTPEGWDDPPVAWELSDVPDAEGPLDDRIGYSSAGDGTYAAFGPADPTGRALRGEMSARYTAPSARRWKDAGEPTMRWLVAYAGSHDIIPIEGWEEESLWHAVPIYANVGLILRKYIAHLRMRVGPTDLMKENPITLDLGNPAVEKALVREVDVYLEIED